MKFPDVDQYLDHVASEKIIAVAPGSVWATKKYPQRYFKEIIEKLIDKQLSVVLIGGKEDFDICEDLNLSPDDYTFNLAGKLTIPESTAVISKCRLLVCNDSAPTHMGVSAGIPVLTIYCSTVPEFGFYPYNEGSIVLSYDNLECKPCGIHGHNECPEKTFDCANLLNPSVVLEKIFKIIGS
jgi:heptosyltransferase-2